MSQPVPRSARKAVVLVSGGMDSAVALACARAQGFETYALTVDYGQRHRVELACARKVARVLGAKQHKKIVVDLRSFGGSSLTSARSVPKHRAFSDGKIPSTYVPARNTIFLSLALAWAEVLSAEAIFIGANAVDYSGYPDCRPKYLRAFAHLARLATRAGVEEHRSVKIHAPLLRLSKAGIVRLGRRLGVDFALTHSCYQPAKNGRPCGECDACRLRAKGFAEAKVNDPALSSDRAAGGRKKL
jgi:7-cyano-7-deazaguanine synthase